MNSLKENFRLNEWLSLSVSRVLLVGMMVSTSITFQHLSRFFLPGWHGNYLPWICLLVSLEAIFMSAKLRRSVDLEHSRLYYRLMEWVVILVLVKLVMYIASGLARFLQEVPSYSTNFIESFFSPDYLVVILAVFFCWGMTSWYLIDIQEIEGDVALVDASSLDGYFSNRSLIRKRLGGRVLAIGFVMLMVNAVVAIDYQALWKGHLIVAYQGTLNLVIYFMLGFLLLSQTHFSVLRAGWAWERIPIEPSMARRWVAYSLVALGLVSLVAFLLPTQYSLGLLSTLSFVISIVSALIYGIFFLISAPILYLIGLLSRLLNIGNGPSGDLAPPRLPDPPAEVAGAPLPSWVKVLQSILFWGIFCFVIGFAFVQYIRQNKELVARLRKLRGFHFLAQAWNWLRGRFGYINQAVSAVIGAGIGKIRAFFQRSDGLEPWQFLNPRRLSPRLQVLFYYLAMVRRGKDAGLPRQPSQTPYEYSQMLSRNLPEVEDDTQAMAEAFVEARYSRHFIESEKSSQVGQFWAHIRKALRSLKQ